MCACVMMVVWWKLKVEWRTERNLLFHSKISKLKAKEEGVDQMPVSKDGRNANS